MRQAQRYKLGFLIAVVLTFAAVALVLWLPRPAPNLSVSVTFVKYSKDIERGTMATFAVTNVSGATLLRGDYYELEGQNREGRSGPLLGDGLWNLDGPHDLSSGESELILIPRPERTKEWRIGLLCSHQPRLYRFGKWAAKQPGWVKAIIYKIDPNVKDPFFPITAWSDWIVADPELEAAQ